ncbi:MAG: hypothetical protein KAV01_00200 [Candidatus Lokiarchaeota archaeon]|nr:hypothetical protein [Candidatus Lokiarchaeota archaeon]MCK4478923.1 hypothetical protein [Candidatus Lokiarchaeota archaeon]
MVFKDIFQLYKIGKELGLSRKEINNTLLFKNRYPLVLALMLIVFLSVLAILFWNVALILYAKSTEPVYPRGTLYSSISLKDFRDKK